MKNKVKELLIFKEKQLQEIWNLQSVETKKGVLNDLDKNEIEVKAQISILKLLLNN